MEAVVVVRDETQAVIDAATGAEECIRATTENWELGLNEAGIRIASCVDQVMTPINNATEEIHNFITQERKVAFEAQNMILKGLSEV